MNKKISLLLVLVLVLVLGATLVACGNKNSSTEPGIPEYVAPTFNVAWVEGQTLADLQLPKGFTWDEPLTTLVGEVGPHTFHVTFTPEDTSAFQTITGIAVTVTVKKGTPQPSTIADFNAVYGQTLADIALPDTHLSWQEALTTSVGNAGENVFHVVYTPDDTAHYDPVRDIPVRVIVAKVNYNMTGISLNGATVTYDGQPHSLAITGTLPEGLQVSYEGNAKTSVGTYTVRAVFTPDANHNAPEALTATLQIVKSDLAGITFSGATVVYDGQPHSLAITGTLPAGATVEYQNNGKTNFGTYDVVAHFTVDGNFNDVPDMHATLVIRKANITGITFTNSTVTYDGQEHTLAISGTLPQGVSVDYDYYVFDEFIAQPDWVPVMETVNAEEYKVIASFTIENTNYNALDDMEARLIINPAPVDIDSLVPELMVIDTGDALEVNHRFLRGVNAIEGFDPVVVKEEGNYLAPAPYWGINKMYAFYDVPNYVFYENIEFTILCWDSSLYSVTCSDDSLNILYDAANNVTLRMVSVSGGEANYSQLYTEICGGDIVVYAYAGQLTTETAFANAVPIGVYDIYESAGLFNIVESVYTFSKIDGSNYPDTPSSETPKYVVTIDGSTMAMSFFNPGVVTYVYASEVDNITISFNTIDGEGSDPDELLMFIYNGVYTKQTLPAYGRFVCPWGYEDPGYFADGGYYDLLWKINNDGSVRLSTPEPEYLYGFWDDIHFGGEYYIVASFTNEGGDGRGLIHLYFFDEEVDYLADNFDLSGMDPALYHADWRYHSGENPYIQCVEFIFDQFNVVQGKLVPDYLEHDWFWQGIDGSGNPMSLYFRYADLTVYSFSYAKSLEEAQYTWYQIDTSSTAEDKFHYYYLFQRNDSIWSLNGDLIYMNTEYCDFVYQILPTNGGTIQRNIGDIKWVSYTYYNEYYESNVYCIFTTISNDGPLAYNTTFYVYADSEEDVIAGNYELPFDSDEYNWEWTEDDDYVYVTNYGGEWTYEKHQDKELTIYIGDLVGVYKAGVDSPGIYYWIVLTKEGNTNMAYSYYAATAAEIFNGTVIPANPMTYLRWKEVDGLIEVSSYGEKYMLQLGQDKILTIYTGEIIDEYISYSYDTDDQLQGGWKLTINDIFGTHRAFGYEGYVDDLGNLVWVLDEESIYIWDYSELGDFFTIQEQNSMGIFVPAMTLYYTTNNKGEKVLERSEMPTILEYGYFYYLDTIIDLETGNPVSVVRTYLAILCRQADTSYAFMAIMDGKVAEKDIPTFGALVQIAPTDFATYGILSMLNPDSIGWEYGVDDELVIVKYGVNEDPDVYYYLFYKGLELQTLPFGYEVAYMFEVERGINFYLRYVGNEKKNAYGIAAPYFTTKDELLHNSAYIINLEGGYSWKYASKNGKQYILEIMAGYVSNVYLFNENGYINEFDGQIVYTIEYNKAEENSCTLFFVDFNGLGKIVFQMEGTDITPQAFATAFANGDVFQVGIWMQDGNYVRYLTRAFLIHEIDNSQAINALDDQEFEVVNGELVDPERYFAGEVKAVVVVGKVGDEVTYGFVKYFDEIIVISVDDVLTVTEMQAAWLADNFLDFDEGFILGYNLFMIHGTPYELISEEVNDQIVWTAREAVGETVYFYMEEDEPLYVFNRYGDIQIILMPWTFETDGPILVRPDDLSVSTASNYKTFYYATMGTWVDDPTDPTCVMNFMEYGTYYFIIIDAETGEVAMDYSAIPLVP